MDVVSLRDWAAGIPAHVMDLIVIKLDRLRDYLCFSCVCPQWRDVALETNVEHKVNLDVLKASRKKLPMLMFKTEEHSDECTSLYDVSGGKTYPVKLPLPHKYRFVGSSFGWLFCLNHDMVVTLMNPYNKGCISLPPLVEDPKRWYRNYRRSEFDMYTRKGILLSDPCACPNSFVAIVLMGFMGRFAFFKSGGDSWTFIDPTFIIHEIIFYKGKLYGACRRGQLVEFDFCTKSMKTIIPPTDFMSTYVYLVESLNGELLFVRRSWYEDIYYGNDPNYGAHNSDNEESPEDNEESPEDNEEDLCVRVNSSDSEAESMDTRHPKNWDEADLLEACYDGSFDFRVFKMVTDPKVEEEESRACWVEMKNIGEQALFLGDNHSVSVSTTDFPGCLPNHIYFTSEQHNLWYPYFYRGLDEDSGIFNLENGMIHKHHVLDSPKNKYVQPPIWLVPNPRA